MYGTLVSLGNIHPTQDTTTWSADDFTPAMPPADQQIQFASFLILVALFISLLLKADDIDKAEQKKNNGKKWP
jgi:hypothetical protein